MLENMQDTPDERARTRRTRIEERYAAPCCPVPQGPPAGARRGDGRRAARRGRDAQVRAPEPVAGAWRFGQHIAECRPRRRGAPHSRPDGCTASSGTHPLSWMVRDHRWSDALAVVGVVAPVLLLVAALTEFRIPQAVASSVTGHPHWRLTATLGLGRPADGGRRPLGGTPLALLRLRRLAGSVPAMAIGQVVAGAVPSLRRVRDPVVAFTVCSPARPRRRCCCRRDPTAAWPC